MDNSLANIIEIFSSIQGEGPYLGQKQIFVRFSGCNFDCRYCDTNSSAREYCKIYTAKNTFRKIKNPVHYKNLTEELRKLNPINHHSISLTGGEPLINPEFLRKFLKEIKSKFPMIKVYLETNGTLPDELKTVISYTDIISMDIKIESSTFQQLPFNKHAQFIKILDYSDKEFFIKIVINEDIKENEIDRVKQLLKTSNREISLILQPMGKGAKISISPEKLFSVQNEFLKDIKDVRVIPQMHKYLGLQ